MPHDADQMVAGCEAGILRRVAHAAERLVAEDQALVALGRFAVMTRNDLVIGAADAERNCLDQNRAVVVRRFGDILQSGGVCNARKDRDGKHIGPDRWISRPEDDSGSAEKFLPERRELCVPEHQIVPVHHLGAALDAENEQDVA